jgi:hypothetical protein
MNSNNSSFTPPKSYDILKYGEPYSITKGKFAGQFRNMYWKVKDKNDDTYYMMHIIDNIYTKISKRDINRVLLLDGIRPSWYLHDTGYIASTTRTADRNFYYLHQLIMDVHDKDNSDFEETVDHINRDKLDNRQSNLRLVNMSVQNSNRDKPERRIDACDLPNGIVQTDLPKYVVYRNERYKLSNDNDQEDYNYREYFYICNHPKLDKRWETTKSMNVTIHEKLKQAKLKLQELDGDITTKQYNKQSGLDKIIDFPVGIRLIEQHDKKQLVFDLRKDNDVVHGHVRYNIKMVLKSTNLQTELDKFIDMINTKYSELKMDKYIIKNIPKIKETEISTNNIVKEEDNTDLPILLPSNITFYNEKEKYYFEFNKSVDKVRKNVKYTLKSNDIQSELNKFIENVNTKYPELKIPNYTIQHIPEKYKNIIKQPEVIQNDTKPDRPNNFSICNVNGTDYIQFCKKIDNKKHQYKTRINSYDLQSELNRFVDYLNETYKFATVLTKENVTTNGWRTTNNLICHDDTSEKLASRERANNYNMKKREEMGEEKYKELLRVKANQLRQTYRNMKEHDI